MKTFEKVYTQNEEAVRIVQGLHNFYKIINEMKPAKTFKYLVKNRSLYNPVWERKDKEDLKRGVNLKILTRHTKQNDTEIKKWSEEHKKRMRFFDNKGVTLSIRDDEAVITLIKNNTILSIKDEAFIDLMKRWYEIVYQDAPPLF